MTFNKTLHLNWRKAELPAFVETDIELECSFMWLFCFYRCSPLVPVCSWVDVLWRQIAQIFNFFAELIGALPQWRQISRRGTRQRGVETPSAALVRVSSRTFANKTIAWPMERYRKKIACCTEHEDLILAVLHTVPLRRALQTPTTFESPTVIHSTEWSTWTFRKTWFVFCFFSPSNHRLILADWLGLCTCKHHSQGIFYNP